jgi:hypothetical protein
MMGLMGKDIAKGAIVLGTMTAMLLVLPFILKLWEDVEFSDFIVPALVLAGMIGIAFLVGKVASSKNNIAWGLIALAGIMISLTAMKFIIDLYKDVTVDELGIPALVMGGMLAAAYAVSAIGKIGPTALIGVATLASVVGAMWGISEILDSFKGMTVDDLAVPGIVMGGMLVAAGITAAIGLLGPAALIGLVVVAGIAGSLWIVSKALQNFGDVARSLQGVDLEPETAKRIAKSVGIIALGLVAVGNPLTLPLLIAGIGASIGIAKGVDSLSTALSKSSKVNLSVATANATAIVTWSKSAVKQLTSLSLKQIAKGSLALKPIRQLGTTLALLAAGMTAMANGTYTEYKIVNGEQVAVAIHKIGPATYTAYGKAVSEMIDALKQPIIDIGKTSNFFGGSDFEDGIEALKFLPNIVTPIIDIAKNSEVIKKGDYTGLSDKEIEAKKALKSLRFKGSAKEIPTSSRSASSCESRNLSEVKYDSANVDPRTFTNNQDELEESLASLLGPIDSSITDNTKAKMNVQSTATQKAKKSISRQASIHEQKHESLPGFENLQGLKRPLVMGNSEQFKSSNSIKDAFNDFNWTTISRK